MAIYVCAICGYMYDESGEFLAFSQLPENWTCPVCGNTREYYHQGEAATAGDAGQTIVTGSVTAQSESDGSAVTTVPTPDAGVEPLIDDIVIMAQTGESIVEPMRTREPVISWDEILPEAKTPLDFESPLLITHMSCGALSKEAKIALATGSAAVITAMSSGEGGILRESMQAAPKYIFEYVPNRYSVTDEYLQTVDAVEIRLGQSAKPGMGGHLPGEKVTNEIAEIRGFAPGNDPTSPAHHDDIHNGKDLAKKTACLRDATGGKPIGVKLAAGDLEADLDVVLGAKPDFVTTDGRAGATGASPKFVKRSTSVPTLFALHWARKTQDPELRKAVDVEAGALRVENFLRVSLEEVAAFAGLTGHRDVHEMPVDDLWTSNSEVSGYTTIRHV